MSKLPKKEITQLTDRYEFLTEIQDKNGKAEFKRIMYILGNIETIRNEYFIRKMSCVQKDVIDSCIYLYNKYNKQKKNHFDIEFFINVYLDEIIYYFTDDDKKIANAIKEIFSSFDWGT